MSQPSYLRFMGNGWPEHVLGDAYEGPAPSKNGDARPRIIIPGAESAGQPGIEPLPILTAGELIDRYPAMRPPIIDGLLRVGETMNLISAPKVGKSWCVLDLAFAVATGQPWLTFTTTPGKVLIIDNELHPETIAHRIKRMAEARGIPLDMIRDTLSVVSLRGRVRDLTQIGMALKGMERGRFLMAILDAFYRTLPMQTDENDNATMAALYNAIDGYADALGAGFALVHHSSKGNQSERSVTDVGAGAGAQSRATDTHLILRPHEEENIFVLDAAVRSWAPVAPRCLRWAWPVWTPAPDLDPLALRSAARRRKAKDEAAANDAGPPWTAKRFAETFGKPEPLPAAALLDAARSAALPDLSERMAEKLLKAALDCGNLHRWPCEDRRKLIVATVPPGGKARTRKR